MCSSERDLAELVAYRSNNNAMVLAWLLLQRVSETNVHPLPRSNTMKPQKISCIAIFGVLLALGSHSSGHAQAPAKGRFYGQRTNQVVNELRKAGNQYSAAHRNERNLMHHQFYGRRDDYGYRTTGRAINGHQAQARGDVNAAVKELRNRMQWISDPRQRGKIEATINKVDAQMRNADSRTRAYTPYLNAGGARYKKTW